MRNQTYSTPSLLWYDYETWGANPQRDRLAQFAAVRTDLDLEPIGEPIDLYCQPAIDTVIDPGAVMITGLSPLTLKNIGLNEWDFAHKIHAHMSLAGTCTVGYNSIRFDDECTRYLLYRNLLDPYAREWKNGNSRWDLLDVMRMTKALRPDGITWPTHEDGSPSFKLEHLTAANGIAHEQAHDAVSDVKATIALAKRVKQQQPKLYDYAFRLRTKTAVLQHIDFDHQTPHLHFSGKIPAREHCMGIEVPLMIHPDRSNEVIVIDIRDDPSWLLNYDADTLRQWLYSKADDLPEGQKRPPLRTIHINRSPMIAPISLLTEDIATRLSIDAAAVAQHQNFVQHHPELQKLALQIFTAEHERTAFEDPEHALYEGFIDRHDRDQLNHYTNQSLNKADWLSHAQTLHDPRLPTLIENILARHFQDSLTESQWVQWQQNTRDKLLSESQGQPLTLEAAIIKTSTLLAEHPDNKALQETHTYLTNLSDFWFKPNKAHATVTPKPESHDSETEADAAESEIPHNQLDLF